MALKGWIPFELVEPRMAWTKTGNVRKGNPARGDVSQNVRKSPGIIFSRPGIVPVQAVGGKVTGIYNWISNQNLVLFQEDLKFQRLLLSTSTVHTMFSAPAGTRAPSFADLGPRIYCAGWDTIGSGTFQARVHDGQEVANVPNVEKCFRPPLSILELTGSAVDGGSGQCTKGTHKIGFIYTNRDGYSGKPSPANSSGILTPFSVTLNAGLRTINVTVNVGSIPDGGPGTLLTPIMTRADAPDTPWYFVPDGLFGAGPFAIPLSSATSLSFQISISDEDLAASATSALDQFSLLSQDMSGNGPFNPSTVAAYGKRMCYVRDSRVYVSDIDDPQSIAEDRNVVEMLNKRTVRTVFPLGNGQDLYLTGDHWTGAVTDNGDFPATWPEPRMVSGTHGAAFPDLVEWRTAGSYAWFAEETGVYLFDGNFGDVPVTHLWDDQWKRVNWAASYAIKIRDHVLERNLYVAVPLDGATEPTHQFVIHYTNGKTFDTVDISLDVYASNPTFSSIGIVQETNDLTVPWIGPSGSGQILHFDPTFIPGMGTGCADVGIAIDSLWSSGLLRGGGELPTKLIRVGAADLWLHGTGLPVGSWRNNDKTLSLSPVILQGGCVPVSAISPTPGIEYQQKFDLARVENFSFLLEMSGQVGASWMLSGIRAYCKPSLGTR